MNFADAITCAQDGERIRRAGWNNKGAFVIFVRGQSNVTLRAGTPYHAVLGPATVNIQAHFDMIYPAAGDAAALCCPGWLASQADMLADDWEMI